MDLHPIRQVKFNRHLKPLTGNVIYLNGFTPNLTSHNLNGFTPNLTGRIQPASKAFNRQCNLSQWIYTQFDRS